VSFPPCYSATSAEMKPASSLAVPQTW